jgi:protein-disulfide isomerase
MSKRQEMREKRSRQQRNNRTIAIVLISLGALALAFLLIYPNIKPVGEVVNADPNPRPQANMNAMGDPNAPVTILEYSDFQCPYCRNFWENTEAQIVENYVKTGKVYFVYHSMDNFVSDNINRSQGTNNTESRDAAHAAYCAGDENKYWEYHDMLFTNWNGENQGAFSRKRLDAFAEALGLDTAAFKACMDSDKYMAQVKQDAADGEKDITSSPEYDSASGYGTPAFIINGKLIQGAQPFSVFQQEIEAALAAAGSN